MHLSTVERLNVIVNRERLSASQLARTLDLNATTLAHYLNGQRNPSRFVRLYLDQAADAYDRGGTKGMREFAKKYLD